METVWLESHPECPVCLQPCLQPVQTPCLHVFCFLCLKGFVYRSKRCALCRSEVPFEYFQNPVVVGRFYKFGTPGSTRMVQIVALFSPLISKVSQISLILSTRKL